MDFIEARAELIRILSHEIKDKRVLDAMGRVPREYFVTQEVSHLAYANQPLPIGQGQTISQPTIIALMTEALELTGGENVLEIGTGSGYQTAILAELAGKVITVERFPALAEKARKTLERIGYTNIEMHPAGETLGYPPKAPYDAIIVTAGAPKVPKEFISQLIIGGRLVIPVGTRHAQELYQITRLAGRNIVRDLGGCRFVPLVGKGAWEEDQSASRGYSV